MVVVALENLISSALIEGDYEEEDAPAQSAHNP
jgi:hypothetical protein